MSLSIRFLAVVLSCLGCENLQSEAWYRDASVFVASGNPLSRAGLRDYFRSRTPSADELNELPTWLKRLGDDEFETRERASRKLLRFGKAAAPALRSGGESADPEVLRRCKECLWEMEREPLVTAAAARLLASIPDANTTWVLLDYLPFAVNREVESELLAILASLPPNRRPSETDLKKMLADKCPARRHAANLLLAQSPHEDYHHTIVPLLRDSSAEVRLRAAQALLPHGEIRAAYTLFALSMDSSTETAQEASDLFDLLPAEIQSECEIGCLHLSTKWGSELKVQMTEQCHRYFAEKSRWEWEVRRSLQWKVRGSCGYSDEFHCELVKVLRETTRLSEAAKRTLRLWGVPRNTIEQLQRTATK